MLLLLYSLTSAALLWLLHRFVCRLSRGAAALLFLLPFLFTGYALIANRVYAPVDKIYLSEPLSAVRLQQGIGAPHNPVTADVFSQLIPWRHAVREAYGRGEWPLWNPYILSGDILAAAAQPAPYSPFTLIAILLPAPVSFTFTAAIAFFLAGAGAFAFARELGCRESAASIAAGGFAFSAGIALYVLWPLGLSWALLPLVMLGARRVVHTPSAHSWALLTTALVLLILAGHPESVLHVVVLGAVYALFEKPRVKAIAVAVAAGIVALLLCAMYLLPILEALPQTAEYAMRGNAAARSDTTAQVLVSLATDVFPFLHVRRWIDPAVPGLKAETPAVGSIILALAIYAIWRVRSLTSWFFAAMALFCIAAHAAWEPVARALHALPLFDMTINERFAFGGAFFLAMLAAMGAEEIARRMDARAAAVTLTIVLALLAAGTLWITRAFAIAEGPADWGEYKIFAELAFLGGAALLFALRAPMRVALPALVALLLVQRVMSDGGVHKSFPREAAYPPMELFEPLKTVREPFRIVGQTWALIPGTSALYGLEDVRGYQAMTFGPYQETYRHWSVPQPVFFNRVDDLSKPFLSMLNVRYAFGVEWTAPPPGWRVIARQRYATLMENANALERAFVPRSVIVGAGEMDGAADFRERAWIASNEKPYERTNGPGRVTLRRIPYGYELDADMQGDGWIVITESAWKGWRAYVDVRRNQPMRANHAFLSVHVPPGKHHVRLVYWPESFVVGRGITLATLLGIVVFGVMRLRFAP